MIPYNKGFAKFLRYGQIFVIGCFCPLGYIWLAPKRAKIPINPLIKVFLIIHAFLLKPSEM